jgi:predicted amidohydrolase
MKTIDVALAQMSCKLGNKKENIKRMKRFVDKGKSKGADIIIFPEFSLTGYSLRDQVYDMAETIPGPSTDIIAEISKKTGIHIVYGMPEVSEKTQATLYNTSVITGPKGYIGKYRKMYLPTHSVFEEKRYFRPGYQATTFETEVGNIGLIICYDAFFPEVSRMTRLKGAQLIICISASPATRRQYFEILTSARAIENTCFLAYVNLVGIENGLQFWGGSRLISPTGKIIVKAKHDEEDLVIGSVVYQKLKTVEAFVPTLKDLRPELYVKLKDYAENL